MRRSKSLVYPYHPHPAYVNASLAEFVRRRVFGKEAEIFPAHSLDIATKIPQIRPRKASAPAKPPRKSVLSERNTTTTRPKQAGSDSAGLAFSARSPMKSGIKSAGQEKTCCPCCGMPLRKSQVEPSEQHCRGHCCKRRQSLPKKLTGKDDDASNGETLRRKRRSCSFLQDSKKEKPTELGKCNVTKEVTKYSFSCGFTVTRKVKTKSANSVDNEESSDREKRSAKFCQDCRDFSGGCSQASSRDRVSTGHQTKLAAERKDENKQNDDASPVRLRRRKAGYLSRPKPRPTSDTVLYSNNYKSSHRTIQLYEFDEDFNSVKAHQREQSAESTMKTAMSKKPVRIRLLNDDSVVLVFDVKASVQQLFDQVCSVLSVREQKFFGLSTVVDNEKRFMELKHKIARYAPKEWGKEIKRRASDIAITSAALLTVQFQVQFYVEHPKLISDKTSRHLYYLQMKKNLLRSQVLTQDEVLITLASYALQADFGDHNPDTHKMQYFRPEDYFPSWFIRKWSRDYLLLNLPSLHAEQNGRTVFEAQALYIQQASTIDDVPVHYYELFKNKREAKPSVRLGVFHQGVRIYYGNSEKTNAPWKLEFEFMWSKVGRLFFTGKRFEIYPEDLPASRKLMYYTGSHARSKYLLHFLRETHSIYMSLSPYAQQMRRVEGKKTKRRYRESYISGKNLNLESAGAASNEQQSTDNEGVLKPNQDNEKTFQSCYQSMTSHGSSHTSGIESDSKQRTEGEDEEDEADHYVDNFDPVEADRRKDFVHVTEDHLAGPPPKSLSVTNLANYPQLLVPVVMEKSHHLHGSVIDVKKSSKPSRDSTLTGEDLCIPSVLPAAFENTNADLKTSKYSSMSSEDREDTLKNGVTLEVLMTAALKSKIPEGKPEGTSWKNEKAKRRESSTSRSDRKQVKGYNDNLTATPRKASKNESNQFYFDDFHSVPRKPRVRSHTEDTPYSARELRSENDTKRSHQGHSRHPQHHHVDEKRNAKKSSSAYPQAHTTQSVPSHRAPTDSSTWLPSSRPIERTRSSDQSTPAFVVGGDKIRNRHGKSVSSIPATFHGTVDFGKNKRNSAFVAVAKPNKYGEDVGHYTVAHGCDKYVYYDDVKSSAPNGSIPKGTKKASGHKERKRHSYYEQLYHPDSSDNRERLSSFEDENFSQKMSEACMRTLSAQRRKLSDSKFAQRMDSGRGSLRTTTDDSSSCLDVSPTSNMPPDFISSPRTPYSNRNPAQYDLLSTPYIENYNEVIV